MPVHRTLPGGGTVIETAEVDPGINWSPSGESQAHGALTLPQG
jgi:hypothetical protein